MSLEISDTARVYRSAAPYIPEVAHSRTCASKDSAKALFNLERNPEDFMHSWAATR